MTWDQSIFVHKPRCPGLVPGSGGTIPRPYVNTNIDYTHVSIILMQSVYKVKCRGKLVGVNIYMPSLKNIFCIWRNFMPFVSVFYKCNLCDFKTWLQPSYKGHMAKMHGQTPKTYVCHWCKEEVKSMVDYKTHLQVGSFSSANILLGLLVCVQQIVKLSFTLAACKMQKVTILNWY